MKINYKKSLLPLLALCLGLSITGCANTAAVFRDGSFQEVDLSELSFPLKEEKSIQGMISFPPSTESDPNKKTIFKRLEEDTNVHVNWRAIQSDQWPDKIQLAMSNPAKMSDFVFSAGFSDNDLLRYADQGVIIPLEDYIDAYMPNLKAVFEKYPEYKAMSTDPDGHIWALPWIEQLGSNKTAIQTISGMSFINKKWLDFLGLEIPETVEEFEQVLIAFKDNADKLQKEFNIEGSIIPMSAIINDGDQDPAILTNGFGEGYGDNDHKRHIAVTDDKQVISTAVQPGFREGIEWLHKLYEQGLIDNEAFTQEWANYVAKGKSGRYGVCFSWDVANIDNLQDWVPLPPLKADKQVVTPENGSYTSGYDRGRTVITAKAQNPALVAAWLDQMYAPLQSPQNNWGTYGEDDNFDIFEMGVNEQGEPMLQHADLGDESPVEVREKESVGRPLAILDDYYGEYVTTPGDAQYRLDWIEDYYTPYMKAKYVYPNVFMSQEDSERLAILQTDIEKYTNMKRSEWIRDGLTDKDWEEYLKKLNDYGLEEYLAIFQKNLDSFYDEEKVIEAEDALEEGKSDHSEKGSNKESENNS